jgi:hypothetical protein
MTHPGRKERVWNDPPMPGETRNSLIIPLTEIKSEEDLHLVLRQILTFNRKVMFFLLGVQCMIVALFLLGLNYFGAGIEDMAKFLVISGIFFMIVAVFLIPMPRGIEKR